MTPDELDRLRAASRDFVARARRHAHPGLAIEAIGFRARAAARKWPMPDRRVDWDWTRITKRMEVRRIDAAFWVDETLCGMAYGKITTHGPALTRLEGAPGEHVLKGHITDLAIAVLETLAAALGSTRTMLEDPDPDLIAWYRLRGYLPVADPELSRYLVKERAAR